MSNTILPILTDELALVTGGNDTSTGTIAPDEYARVGTPGRCAYLDQAVPSRERMILRNAIAGTLNGKGPAALGEAVYGDAVILSRDRMEQRLRCARG